MAEYAPGMRVLIRNEEWMIRKVETNSMGNKALYCVGISTLVRDKEAVFLEDLDEITSMNPAEINLVPDKSSHFMKTRIYLESQWRQKIPTDNNLHIGYDAVMDTMDFQLEPTKIALQKPRQRILIADTVGLGKTLEAGILMSELIARGKGKRILVVTVKSMMTQFQKEMWNRFTIPLVRLDSNRIHKIRAKLPTNYNPFYYYDRTIISMDTLKRDIEYRTHLENSYWDIIVIDEAHNVAARGGHQAQRSRLAELLSERSDTMIMLSATPHDGRSQSFASLMRMLDKTAIPDEEHYTKEDIQGLCIRRFKNDVKDQLSSVYKERKMSIERCVASKAEEAAYDYFADMQLDMDRVSVKGAGKLFKTSLEKALFSSPAACIKSIDERLRKLYKKHTNERVNDIEVLEELKAYVAKIDTASFSRYQKLLSILCSSEFNWSKDNTEDRIVIFTERIETMKYLATHLREDLGMSEAEIVEISGADSDEEQQNKVEDFARSEAKVRILVASDVASEGLNLHYLCHRLFHFDIPWSLMVFQQRNGRVDRYGQKYQPDIRYLLTESQNTNIKGDNRIMEILIDKEEQANANIGDPALLMGKFNQEEEEQQVAAAIENQTDGEKFAQQLDDTQNAFNPLEFLMRGAASAQADVDKEDEVKKVVDKTLFTDIDYLEEAVNYFNRTEKVPAERFTTASGLKIRIEDGSVLANRLKALLPEEVYPKNGYLMLSDDKAFCVEKMRQSMQNTMEEDAWPDTQYLWKLHPIFNWVNDKAGLLFKRTEAPIIGVNTLAVGKKIFIVSGSIPNRKSTPLVDEIFGVEYENGHFASILNINAVVDTLKLKQNNLANADLITDIDVRSATALLPDVIRQAKFYMEKDAGKYEDAMNPKLDEELNKLVQLEKRHEGKLLELFKEGRVKNEKQRQIEALFKQFVDWVTDTLTIQKDNPYLKILAVVSGVE